MNEDNPQLDVKGSENSSGAEFVVAGGPVALRKLSELICLNRFEREGASVRLSEAKVFSNSMKLIFERAEAETVQVWMAPMDEKQWLSNNTSLKFSVEGAEPSPLEEDVVGLLVKNLDGIPFRMLQAIVEKNALIPTEDVNEGMGADSQPAEMEVRAARPSIKQWGHPDQWREFCCYEYLVENATQTMLGQFEFGGAAVTLRHGELECQHSMVQDDPGGGKANLLKFFQKRIFSGAGRTADFEYFLTFINEKDVVMGTGAVKVRDILDYLAGQDWCGSVEFKNCCVPMMIGDDVRTHIRNFTRKTGKPIYFEDMKGSREERFADFFKEQVADNADARGWQPGRYNMVGFQHWRGRDNIIRLLAGAGAALNVAIMPEFDTGWTKNYLNASVQLLLPNRSYLFLYRYLQALDIKSVCEPGPFGIKGTRNWFERAAAAIGGRVSERVDSVWAETWAVHADRWNELVEEAEGYRLGFVLGDYDAENLADVTLKGGILLSSVVEEMGFGLDFLVYEAEDAGREDKTDVLLKTLEKVDRHRVFKFSTREDLNVLLGSGEIAAVYSNLNYDYRLARNGLAGFTIGDFYMGVEGALYSLEKLLEICRLTFYKRYEKYLF